MAWRAIGLAVSLVLVGCLGAGIRPDDPRLENMVYVPAGSFIMGHSEADGKIGIEVAVDSMPAHKRYLPGFWIDRTEVVYSDYLAFIKATDGRTFSLWAYSFGPPAKGEAAIAVNFDNAQAYCRWKGKRLPTEAEWEKAARGPDGRLFPWGNRWEPDRVVYRGSDPFGPAPVGRHPENASPYGALDMAGNVMEWTDSWYDRYPGSDLEREAFGKKYRVLKGGSWETGMLFARSANRFSVLPTIGQPSFGFRCVLSGKGSPGIGKRFSK